MAEANSTPSAPAADAGEAPVERAPAELKTGPEESAPEPNANGAEEKPAESATAQEGKKDSSDAPAEKPDASTEAAAAQKSDEGAPVPAKSEAAAAPGANGTPSSAKKSSSKRKSTGADTKSKLNRKKSQSRITHLDAKPGDYYLARLRSFAPWPAIVCDEEILPQTLLSTRPVTAQRPDGTYREDFADGGRRVGERTFPVMFLHTNEFAWIPNTDLTPLDPASCKDVSEKGKSKSLIAAFGVAAENHDLAYFKDLLANHQRAIQEEEEEREAQAAAKAAAKADREAKKNKRKSMEIHDDVDMEDAEEGGKQPKSSKKRKKDTEDGGDDKPAKTPKTGTKLKLTTPKTPSGESGKKGATSGRSKQTASGKKGKAAASDESDGSRPVSKEPEPQVNLEEAKKKRDREVLFVRHRLQKGFISRDQPPKEEEMAQMSGYLTKLEKIEDLEVSIIRETKIHKVLRMIIKLPSIPRDEEFQFRKRALDILSKWKNVLDSDRATPAQEKEKDEKPKANGVHKETSAETPAKTEKDESKLETPDQDVPMPDADAAKEKTVETPAAAGEAPEKEKSVEGKAEEKTAEAEAAA
ncbi:PWWP domain protein [Aspergillus lucknowensis]|uniref:PWWP domain-containing protein n=1 Tax=Aspergillus lucknowensis TaxID=176173 RepID=A0ABR4LZP4_9EURO